MMRFWVTCNDCGDTWVSGFIPEHGELIATDSLGTTCSDCGGTVEIGDEYEPGEDREYEREVPFDL